MSLQFEGILSNLQNEILIGNKINNFNLVVDKMKELNATGINQQYDITGYNDNFNELWQSALNLIITKKLDLNTKLNSNGMDTLLMADQANTFVCNSIETFERIIDVRTGLTDLTLLDKNYVQKINDIKDELTKFSIFTENSVDTIMYSDDETLTDVVEINNKIKSLVTLIYNIQTAFEQLYVLINLTLNSLQSYIDILRVNTVVGTSLSITTKAWNLAIALNKHNYKKVVDEDLIEIKSELRQKEIFNLEAFPEFPKYINTQSIINNISTLQLLKLDSDCSFNIEYNNTITKYTVVIKKKDSSNIDNIFGTNIPLLSSINDLKFNYIKLSTLLELNFDYSIYIKFLKDVFVINNFDLIYDSLIDIDDIVNFDSEKLKIYNQEGFDILEGCTYNVINYIKNQQTYNVFKSMYSYKYSDLNNISNVVFDMSYFIPEDFYTNSNLYSNGINPNDESFMKFYNVLEDTNSDNFNEELNTKLINFINSTIDKIFSFSNKNENKIISIYREENNTQTLIQSIDVDVTGIGSEFDYLVGNININNIDSNLPKKFFKNFDNYLSKVTGLDIVNDDEVNVITKQFDAIFTYNKQMRLIDFNMLNEVITTFDGYKSETKIETKKYRVKELSVQGSPTEWYLDGLNKIEITNIEFITDNYVVRIATNVSNIFRKQLIQQKIKYNDARFKAIRYSLKYLRIKENFDNFIDKTWEANIPKYNYDEEF